MLNSCFSHTQKQYSRIHWYEILSCCCWAAQRPTLNLIDWSMLAFQSHHLLSLAQVLRSRTQMPSSHTHLWASFPSSIFSRHQDFSVSCLFNIRWPKYWFLAAKKILSGEYLCDLLGDRRAWSPCSPKDLLQGIFCTTPQSNDQYWSPTFWYLNSQNSSKTTVVISLDC